LVESALGEALGVQRHRHDQIDLGQRPGREVSREESGKRKPGAILERLHEPVARKFVAPKCERRVEVRGMVEAAPAHRRGGTGEAVQALFELPFNDLLYRAQTVHRLHFDANAVQLSTLLSIKTGGCPEDCAYCPQSARYRTGVENEPLVPLETVLAAARAAKENGATRFCMGAAWRGPKQKDLEQVAQRVRAVKALGLETCATLGLLREGQAEELKAAGLDYYNHNLDTAPEFYGEIITTRTYGDRLDTLARVRRAGIKVCCGGIVGMGESRTQR